jgi:hypothetical protein
VEQCAGRLVGARRLSGEGLAFVAMVHDWQAFLDSARPEGEVEELRKHLRTGWPLGDEAFLDRLEGLVERVLKPKKAGRQEVRKSIMCLDFDFDFDFLQEIYEQHTQK